MTAAFLFCTILGLTATILFAQEEPNVPQVEIDCLQDLYDATNGTYWKWKSEGVQWNFTGDPNPCSGWQGINCTDITEADYRHISEVALPGYNLDGTIPKSISGLSYLQVLNLDKNSLYGSIPEDIFSGLFNLTYLSLQVNYLTGQLSSSISQLKNLTYLAIASSNMNGTIPESIGQLHQLKTLCLSNNALSNTIPNVFQNTTNLHTLQIGNNYLIGTIPIDLFQLNYLHELDLSDNFLTGTLPVVLGDSDSLTIVQLDSNRLSGMLPDNIGGKHTFYELFLNGNQLSGSIPDTICSAQNILVLEIGRNSLTGSIPFCVGSLIELVDLTLDSNHLTSSIPASIGDIVRLEYLNLDFNHMTGTIPSRATTDARNVYLYQLSLQGNYFFGSVPKGVWQLPILTQLILSDNYFSGTISESIGSTYRGTTDIGLRLNMFTGSIPQSLSNILSLEYLDLGYNLFTSTLPAEVAHMQFIISLDVQSNYMTGCLPPFGYLERLISLQLLNNRFCCSLDGVFTGDKQPDLVDVDFSYNQFTGTLPVELLLLPQLSTMVATSNCFTGTLPDEVCSMNHLQYFILDGLHASPHCRHKISHISNSYIVYNGFHGTIPPCVLALPQLSYLHMSGNALTGSLPTTLTKIKKVTQLILSHNSLTGTIPAALQTHTWSLLDVSYNLITGTLLSQFGESLEVNATVNIQNNRLSGKVPASLVSLQSISTLGSNMFSCDTNKNELPVNDGGRENYQCGSDDFDAPFYALLVAILFLVLCLCTLRWITKNYYIIEAIQKYANKWLMPRESIPLHCQGFYLMIEWLCRLGVYCAALISFVLVPWYVVASHYWGTYTHQYAWMVSAAFLSGNTPGLIEFFLLTGLIIVVLLLTMWITREARQFGLDVQHEEVPGDRSTASETIAVRYAAVAKCGVYGAFLFVNFVVVVGMNVVFVVVYLTQSSAVLTFFQILMSLFKFFWNAVCARRLTSLAAQGTGRVDRSAGFFTLQVFVVLFNNIAVPCLVVAVLSPSCFYSVFNTPSNVSSTYLGYYCIWQPIEHLCYENIETSSYEPPFIYDYQCSSSFVTFYAPTFVYLAIAASLVTPVVNLTLAWFVQQPSEYKILQRISMVLLPRYMKPLEVLTTTETSMKSLVDPNYLLSVLFIYFGVMMTFGVVFPPIAAAMCFTMLSVSWHLKLAVGRLICNAREINAQKILEEIEQECTGSAFLDKFRGGMLMIVAFGFAFYALFVFDTIGDSEGLQGAYWVLIVMPLISLCLFAVARIRRNIVLRAATSRLERAQESTFTDEAVDISIENAIHEPVATTHL